jgi:hypothetical protein
MDALPGGSAMRCPKAAKPRRIFGRSRLNGFSDLPHRRQAETSVRAGPSSKRSVGAALALAFHVHPLLDLFETTGEIFMVLGSDGHPEGLQVVLAGAHDHSGRRDLIPRMSTIFDDILHLRDRSAACLVGNGPALPSSSCHQPDFAARDVSRHRPPSHLRFTHG